MAILRKTASSLQRAAHLFFCCQLRIRLRGGLRVELAERDSDQAPTPAEQEIVRQQAEVGLMLQQLAHVLDEDPDIRPALRHLAYIEYALAQKGVRALYKVPLDVLNRAHEQLEGLVTNWEPRGLASLRSKMAVAVMEREAEGEGDLDAQDQPASGLGPRAASA